MNFWATIPNQKIWRLRPEPWNNTLGRDIDVPGHLTGNRVWPINQSTQFCVGFCSLQVRLADVHCALMRSVLICHDAHEACMKWNLPQDSCTCAKTKQVLPYCSDTTRCVIQPYYCILERWTCEAMGDSNLIEDLCLWKRLFHVVVCEL